MYKRQNGDRTITNTATYAAGNHFFRVQVSTTDTNYNTTLNNLATWARTLLVVDNSGVGFNVVSAQEISQASSAGGGSITAVTAGTNLNGGGGSGNVTLNLDSTINGNHTFANNLVVQGNFTVDGTTTTIDSTVVDIADLNITLSLIHI